MRWPILWSAELLVKLDDTGQVLLLDIGRELLESGFLLEGVEKLWQCQTGVDSDPPSEMFGFGLIWLLCALSRERGSKGDERGGDNQMDWAHLRIDPVANVELRYLHGLNQLRHANFGRSWIIIGCCLHVSFCCLFVSFAAPWWRLL